MKIPEILINFYLLRFEERMSGPHGTNQFMNDGSSLVGNQQQVLNLLKNRFFVDNQHQTYHNPLGHKGKQLIHLQKAGDSVIKQDQGSDDDVSRLWWWQARLGLPNLPEAMRSTTGSANQKATPRNTP